MDAATGPEAIHLAHQEREDFVEQSRLKAKTRKSYDAATRRYLADIDSLDSPSFDSLAADTVIMWIGWRAAGERDSRGFLRTDRHGNVVRAPYSPSYLVHTVAALREFVRGTPFEVDLADKRINKTLRDIKRKGTGHRRLDRVTATIADVRALMLVPAPEPSFRAAQARAALVLRRHAIPRNVIDHLTGNDVKVRARTVVIRTRQDGRVVWVTLHQTAEELLCPVATMREVLKTRGGDEALFRNSAADIGDSMARVRSAARIARVPAADPELMTAAEALRVSAHCDLPYVYWVRDRLLVLVTFLGGMRMASARTIPTELFEIKDKGVLVTLLTNKHDKDPLDVAIRRSRAPELCPSVLGERWLAIGGPKDGWLFPSNKGGPLGESGANHAVRALAARAGVRVNCHSFRRGFVTIAYLCGYTLAEISRKTGQRLSTVEIYVALTSDEAATAARAVEL